MPHPQMNLVDSDGSVGPDNAGDSDSQAGSAAWSSQNEFGGPCRVDLWDPSIAADIQQAVYHQHPAANGSSYHLVPADNDASELLVAPEHQWLSGNGDPTATHM